MRAIEAAVLAYLFNAMWQAPLISVAAWAAARLLRSEHPRVEHRLWVIALLVDVVLPACDPRSLNLMGAVRAVLFWGHAGDGRAAHVNVLFGSGIALDGPYGVAEWLRAGTALAFLSGVLFVLARLLWGLRETHRLTRTATPLHGYRELWKQCCEQVGVSPAACTLAVSEEIAVPMTVGVFPPLVLLPPAVLEGAADSDLRAVLTHELVHVAQRDFAWNFALGLLALPVAWHPLVRLVQQRLAESRELACDAVAADLLATRLGYARSLVHLASLLAPVSSPRANLHAVGFFDGRTFERRIMTLTRQLHPPTLGRRVATGALCCLLTLATCGTALALHAGVVAPSPAPTPAPGKSSGPAHVSAGVIAGNKVAGNVPVYPEEAKKAKVQGAVVLKATISETGAVEHLTVLSGPKELRPSAIDAVHTWQYRPFLLNGEAVPVETTITVTYNLAP